MLSSAPGSNQGFIRSADSCRRAVRTENRDLALPPVASTKWIRNRATDCSDTGKAGRLADSAKAAYRRASRDLARALLEEAIADRRIENLESAAEKDEGGGCESCEGIRTELPSGGSGQGVRLRGREAAGNLGPVNVREGG